MDELMEQVPDGLREVFANIVALTDAFCDAHLNEEYKQLSREMAAAVCEEGLPVTKGKPLSWASGIVYTLGRINFLGDPSQTPHMTAAQVAKAFGVSQGTMMGKSKLIRQEFDLIPMHPDWCLPSRLEDNPLVWILEVNGFPMDIRDAPREAQVVAYEKGFIPYIPADKKRGDRAADETNDDRPTRQRPR